MVDSSALINRGAILFPAGYSTDSPKPPRRRTIIVTGVARSGTSMVAGALRETGMFFGDLIYDVVHEDAQFIQQLRSKDNAALQELIRTRNAQHDAWGFKAPNLHYMSSYNDIRKFRAPHLIAIFRDPVAIAVRERLSMHADEAKTLAGASHSQNALIEYCARAKCPALMLSYEKALLRPEEFVDTLIDFCGIECDPKQRDGMLAQIEPNKPSYLEMARTTYEGVLEGIVEGRLYGWCRNPDRHQPVEVDVFADDTLIGTTSANRFRRDLAEAGVGNGNHGFFFELDSVVNFPDCCIRVTVRNTIFALENSGRNVGSFIKGTTEEMG